MENNKQARKYELMIIVDANLSNSEKEAIFKETTDIISNEQGKIINSQVWLEKHKFTFPIKKKNEGTYYLIKFEGTGQENEKISLALRLSEKILRYVITTMESPSEVAG